MSDETQSAAEAEPTVIVLSKPAELGGTSYDKMIIREPTGGQWLGWASIPNSVTADATALSIVSGLPLPCVKGLGIRDFHAARAVLATFFEADPEQAAVDAASAELDLLLRAPVTLGKETVTQLHLREPSVAEWEKVDALSGPAADIALVAEVSGVRQLLVERIGVRDLLRAARFFGRFFGTAPVMEGVS